MVKYGNTKNYKILDWKNDLIPKYSVHHYTVGTMDSGSLGVLSRDTSNMPFRGNLNFLKYK